MAVDNGKYNAFAKDLEDDAKRLRAVPGIGPAPCEHPGGFRLLDALGAWLFRALSRADWRHRQRQNAKRNTPARSNLDVTC